MQKVNVKHFIQNNKELTNTEHQKYLKDSTKEDLVIFLDSNDYKHFKIYTPHLSTENVDCKIKYIQINEQEI